MTARTYLEQGEVHLWRAPLDVPPTAVAGLWRSLSIDERERAQRFHRESDRRRFTVRRGRLRALLAAYLDVNPAEVVLVLDDRGKPRLRSPDFAWLHFNLSDSAEVVVFAVARGREVGVDVEQVRADFPVDEVARRFLSLCEQKVSLRPQSRIGWTASTGCGRGRRPCSRRWGSDSAELSRLLTTSATGRWSRSTPGRDTSPRWRRRAVAPSFLRSLGRCRCRRTDARRTRFMVELAVLGDGFRTGPVRTALRRKQDQSHWMAAVWNAE